MDEAGAMMDPNEYEALASEQILDRITKHHIYEGYFSLCDKYEAIPITQEDFVDKYVNILVHQPSYRERAEVHTISDKEYLIDMLEKVSAPTKDILEVDKFPPTEYIIVNKLKDGIICIVILFMDKNLIIAPAYFGEGEGEVDFPEEIFS